MTRRRPDILTEVLSITAQELDDADFDQFAIVDVLNEVLSITAQEWFIGFLSVTIRRFLNEVLSITAQE